MGSEREEEIERFKEFLTDFCDKHNGPVTSDHPLPFRLITFRLTKEEIEGECASWVIDYLITHNNAPPILVSAIVRETVKAILAADLNPFVDENHHGDDEDIEPCIEYNANGLARFVFSTVHEICTEWRENLPVFKFPKRIRQYSLHSIRNTRRKMEDKHVVISDMKAFFGDQLTSSSQKPRSFYAVYDGHGGVDAAYYAAAHLHYFTIQHPQFEESPTRAMLSAFSQADEAFISKAKREGLRSGTTGVTVVIDPDHLHLAWLGDSQAVLMKNGRPITIMEPHSPEREDEKKRIEEMGGCVVWFGAWRVNGSLSVSRSIGDLDYKPYVCSDADTATIPLDGTEECVILACDGLWDGVTKEEACAVIRESIDSGADLSQVSNTLIKLAKDNGSGDNITVLVVYLNPYHQKSDSSPKEPAENVVEQSEPSGSESASSPKVNGEISHSENVSGGTNVNKPSNTDSSDAYKSSNAPVDGAVTVQGLTKVSTRDEAKSVQNISNSAFSHDTGRLFKTHHSGGIFPASERVKSYEHLNKPRTVARSSSESPTQYRKVMNRRRPVHDVTEKDFRSKKSLKTVFPMKHISLTLNRSILLPRNPELVDILQANDHKYRQTYPTVNNQGITRE